jgi:hypothetical protein
MILPFQQKIMLARLLDCAGLSDPIIVAFRKLKKRRMASWPRTDNGRDCFLEDSGNNVAPCLFKITRASRFCWLHPTPQKPLALK